MGQKRADGGITPLPRRLRKAQILVSDAVLFASAFLLGDGTCLAQDSGKSPPTVHSPESYQLGHSPLNEPATLAVANEAVPARYFIPLGSGGINLNAGLKTEYVDNVYLTEDNTKDDLIIIPECDLAAFFPVGQLNTMGLDVGLAYYQYLKNTELNTGMPLVNPNTDLRFNLRTGDFGFRFSESFSYQQNPIYETGGQFYNVYNTALFQRYFNRIGCLATWDQHDLVVSAGYFHENLWSETSVYDYINHASELFSADAMLATSPKLTVGLEGAGSINNFFNSPYYDTWRARVGPALRANPSSFLHFRLGAGYERIQYDSVQAGSLGLSPENTYYAYANVEHELNLFFRQSLTLAHDNQIGFNAANLEGTTVSYALSWNARQHLTISPRLAFSYYDESYGSTTALYHEKFRYYYVGLAAHYQLGQHWQASASWNYRVKDSDIDLAGYAQNEVSLELLYQF
jgi:hypothetical protein